MLNNVRTLEMSPDKVKACELTILMPCLNEARTLAPCIRKAKRFLEQSGIRGEVVIADNGSTDGSQAIAKREGARVVPIQERGYGAALIGGIHAARGRYVVMGDSDESYDFEHLEPFVAKLREGYQLVMGNRFQGGIAPGAMPLLHKYLGNPVLTFLGRLFFGSPCSDFHCGLRGFDRAAIKALDLRTLGMEFASEMVVKATLMKLRIAEVPTTLSKDGRDRPPHLRSWHDGWRHLRFLLLHSPRWLFLYPGLALLGFGFLLMAVLLPGPLKLGRIVLDVHSLLLGMTAFLVGLQLTIFFVLAKQFTINEGLLPLGPRFQRWRRWLSLEKALVSGAVITAAGVAGGLTEVFHWGASSFSDLNYQDAMRLLIPSMTALLAGVQIIIAGFLWGILNLKLSRQ